ncbi:MAG: hypothetical protein GDA56_04115 [Hormoscilla sp. GM7CHS1pb]|nr:hypothetical protein [Hormoscilla sp. GM7CHS1pb]
MVIGAREGKIIPIAHSSSKAFHGFVQINTTPSCPPAAIAQFGRSRISHNW